MSYQCSLLLHFLPAWREAGHLCFLDTCRSQVVSPFLALSDDDCLILAASYL